MTTIETMYAPQVNSPATTLSANISSSATSISVLSGATLPAAPNLLVIGGDTENAETVLMTAKSGNTLTVVRGVQGTARAWNSGATIARLFTAKDLADVQTNIAALNSGKAEQTDLAAAEDRIDDIYASSASGPIASYYRTVGGLPVDDLTIDITPVQAGTGDPSPTNVRAISGHTGANIIVNNKNLFSNLADGYFGGAGQVAPASDTQLEKYTPQYIAVGDNTTITYHAENSTSVQWWAGVCCYDESKTFLSRLTKSQTGVYLTHTFDFPIGTKYVRLTSRTYGSTSIQFEFGSEYTGFVSPAYSGTSISWNTEAGAVYGARLDVTTGLLTVTHKLATFTGAGTEDWRDYAPYNGYNIIVSDMASSVRANGVSNMLSLSTVSTAGQTNAFWLGVRDSRIYVLGVYDSMGSTLADFKTYLSTHNLQVTYPLATPITYQLTPAQVTSLIKPGLNNVWADTGDVYVTFGGDIKAYIDETVDDKQDEITASGILKGDGEGGISAAVAGTDYQAPLTAGTDYQTPLDEKALQWYGVCSTSASTQAKTVSITGITALTEGLEIRVKMTNAQTYNGTPTLNVNSLGAKTIKQHGSTDAVRYQWQAGEVISFTYDGTYWVIENNSLATTTYFGLTRLSSSTSSTDESMAATPKAVKTAYDLADAAIPATEKGTDVATLATAADSTTPSVPRLTPAQGFAPLFNITADTTLAAKHAGGILVCTNSPTITIPPNVFAEATEIEIINYGTGVVTIAGASGCSVNGTSAGSVTLADQYKSAVLLAISASQWVVQGAIE